MTQLFEVSQPGNPLSFDLSPGAQQTFAARKGFRNIMYGANGIIVDGPLPLDGIELARIRRLLNETFGNA